MMRSALVIGSLIGWGLGAACSPASIFACSDDAQCNDGVCQLDVGYCSFPDPTCDSGQRYGDYAGDGLAKECVGDDGESELGTTTATTVITTLTTTSSPDTSPADSGTTDEPPSDSSGELLPCPSDWWDCDWGWRMALDVRWSGEQLRDFPVRVSLISERSIPSLFDQGGADLRFVMEQTGEPVAHELELLSGDRGELEAWVQIPELTPGTRVWIYWGNPGAEDSQDPATVWSAGYAAVWHLGSELVDSTGLHHLEDLGTSEAWGWIGRARQFDGASGWLQPASEEGFVDLFSGGGTISAWIRPDGWGEGGAGRIIDNSINPETSQGWAMMVSSEGMSNWAPLRFSMDYQGDGYASWESEPDALELGRWTHVALTHWAQSSPEVPEVYIDGRWELAQPQSSANGEPALTSRFPASIGGLGADQLRVFDGVIDELRLSMVPRSADWLAAEYESDLDRMLDYGSPEALALDP